MSEQKGFSLIEVLVALTLFAMFAGAFVIGQSSNVSDSTRLQNKLPLIFLAEKVVEELKVQPPPLNDSLTLAPEQKRFEEDQWSEYTYQLEWKRLEIPDLASMSENEAETQEATAQTYRAMVMRQITDNIREALWQVRVTVEHEPSGQKEVFSAMIENPNAKIQVKLQ